MNILVSDQVFNVSIQIAGILLAGWVFVIPAVNFLKSRLNLSGFSVQILAFIVATLFGIADILVSGQVTSSDIVWSNLPEIIGFIWFAAETRYRLIKDSQ